MKNADLFPENFMYVLPSPSTYIGAKKIFDEDGAFHRNVRLTMVHFTISTARTGMVFSRNH